MTTIDRPPFTKALYVRFHYPNNGNANDRASVLITDTDPHPDGRKWVKFSWSYDYDSVVDEGLRYLRGIGAEVVTYSATDKHYIFMVERPFILR